MWSRSLKCSLVVVLFASVFLAGSDSVSVGAHSRADASALSSIGAFQGAEDIPGTHDGHKGIRSYNTGFPHDNNANRDVKSYGTPSGNGASHDHGIKGRGRGYNKNDDGCSKCKWENDDYWERDEPEEEGDENDGDECDDGQYRPDKVHHHGPGRGHKSGSHPPEVYKTGPIGVYVDNGIKRDNSPGGPSSSNYPTGYMRPSSGYETTPKPESGWNTPLADASKPGYNVFGTTPSSWPDWNRKTTSSNFGSSPKPVWDSGHDGKFPSSQSSSASIPNFGVTKPGQSWNNQQFSSGSSSVVPHTGTHTDAYAGAYAGTSATSVGSSYGEPSNVGRKNNPFDLYKPGNTPQTRLSGTDQTPSTNEYYGGYEEDNKPGFDSHNTRPTTVTNTFGTTKGPYRGIGSSKTVPGARENPFAPDRSPGLPSGSAFYEHPGLTKPSYSGSTTTSWVGTGQTGSGSNTWQTRTPPIIFPTSNNRFGTTKTPFNHINIPSSTLSTPYDRTRPNQPGINVASSSVITSGSAFEISPDTYSTPSTTGTTFYGTTPAHTGSSSYTPGVKGSIESTRPTYGTVPQGTHPDIGKGSWPGRQPESSVITSGSAFEISPDTYSTPSTTGTTFYGTTPAHKGSSSYTPGVKGSIGSTRPTYGTVPQGTHSDIGKGTWPGRQPESSATTSASAFEISPDTYSTPSTTGTMFYGTTPAHKGSSSYTPGVKGSIGSTRPTYGTVPQGTHPDVGKGTWPGGQPESSIGPFSRKPEDESGITPDKHSPGASEILPGKQPQSGSSTWPGQVSPGYGSGSRAWSTKQPGDRSGTLPGQVQPGYGSGSRCPDGNCGGATGPQEGSGSGAWSTKQPGDRSGTLPGQVQPGYGSGSRCPGGNCGDATGSQEGSNCGGCCSGGGNVPTTHGLCSGAGPSNVHKIYYPAGTGDSNVLNTGTVDGSDSRLNTNYPKGGRVTPESPVTWNTANPFLHSTGGGRVTPESPVTWNTANPFLYPTGGGRVTPENPVTWNTANPFLYPTGGGTSSSVSRPWTSTTEKPIGKGNPFLDPSWSSPKPTNAYNDRNVIPHGEENTKPIGQGNIFLDGSNRRGDVANPNTGVIPFERKIPEGNNPFLRSSVDGSSGLGSPSYGKQPGSLGTSGSFSGSGTSGSFPRIQGSGSYGGGFHSGGAPSQDGNSGRSYPMGSNPQGAGQLECKLGLFGCGTSGSGSYANNKHPGGVFGGGNVGPSTGYPGGVGNVPGGYVNPGTDFVSGANYPGSGGNNLAASVGGAQARAYAGAFSSAQASSSSSAGSFSGASGPANNFGENLSSNAAQNQGGLNSWASSGASAFASSSAGSWSGNRPIDVKG